VLRPLAEAPILICDENELVGRAHPTTREKAMLPVVPSEIVTGSWELICCMFASLAAVMSYVFLMR